MGYAHRIRLFRASAFAIAAMLFARDVHAPVTSGPGSKSVAATAAPMPEEVAETFASGASIRGFASVGSNLISVSTGALATTGTQTVTGASSQRVNLTVTRQF